MQKLSVSFLMTIVLHTDSWSKGCVAGQVGLRGRANQKESGACFRTFVHPWDPIRNFSQFYRVLSAASCLLLCLSVWIEAGLHFTAPEGIVHGQSIAFCPPAMPGESGCQDAANSGGLGSGAIAKYITLLWHPDKQMKIPLGPCGTRDVPEHINTHPPTLQLLLAVKK